MALMFLPSRDNTKSFTNTSSLASLRYTRLTFMTCVPAEAAAGVKRNAAFDGE